MAELTLLDAARSYQGDPLRAGVIEQYASSSLLLEQMPFETIAGTAVEFSREDTLPSVGFRSVNEAWTTDPGLMQKLKEGLKIAGGDLDVDKFIVKQMGEQQRSIRVAQKVKAMGLKTLKTIFKGDETSNPEEFDGLQARIPTGNAQAIDEGSGPLSLANLDALIDLVEDPTHLCMNKAMIRRLITASRNSSIGGQINFELSSFGRRITTYNDIPIVAIDKDNEGNQILPFTEDGASNTSIYCISARPGMFTAIQGGPMEVKDLGEIDDKPVFRTRIEWYISQVIWSKYAVGRLHGITDAAVIA